MVARWFVAVVLLVISCAPASTRMRPRSKIDLDREVWEFGTIKHGETVTTEVTIRNRGGDTLRLSIHSTCDCLVGTMQPEAIEPGREALITLSYTGDVIKETTTKTLFIDSDHGSSQRVSIKVTGTVLAGDLPHMLALPDPLLFDKSESARPYRELTISNRGNQELLISQIRCFGCMPEWDRTKLVGGEEARLRIELLPDWNDSRWIEIESNDPVWPTKKVAIVDLM